MSKKVLREITRLNKVEEISVCTKENPPANRLREFEIIKDSLSKSEFEDLFEELSMPEYGEFTSYLNAWLEEDVNQVAYKAFIDALLASLKDVCFDNEMSKEEKASKMKENFDTFVSEYNNSVITKTEEGKIILNIEKKSTKLVGGFEHPASHFLYVPDPNKSSTWKLQYKDENGNIDPNLVSAAIASFSAGGFRGNKVQLPSDKVAPIKAKLRSIWKELYPEKDIKEMPESINKQERKVNILEEIKKTVKEEVFNFMDALGDSLLNQKVEKSEEEPVVEQEEPQAEAVTEPEVIEEVKVEDAPIEEVAEEPIAEEQPKQVEEVVIEEVSKKSVEEIQEPVEKSEIVEEVSEEISKAQETISSLEANIQEHTKAQEQRVVVIEKAELAKSVQESYSGLTGTQEQIIEHIYSINKSDIPLETKDMILESLKSLSKSNLELTKVVGVETPEEIVKSEEEIFKSKVEKLMKEEGISENKAFAVVKGTMTLKQAKSRCKK